MMDYGAMSLATSIVLGVAVFVVRSSMAYTALAMYLMFAAPHLIIHIRLINHLAPPDRVPLLVALGAAVLMPLALLPLVRRLKSPGDNNRRITEVSSKVEVER